MLSAKNFGGKKWQVRNSLTKKKGGKRPARLARNPFMPLMEVFADAVQSGRETLTARYEKHPFYPRPHEDFYFHVNSTPIPGIYHCLAINRTTLGACHTRYYADLGCQSPEHFKALWLERYPEANFIPGAKVYLYKFSLR